MSKAFSSAQGDYRNTVGAVIGDVPDLPITTST
jgi:hypothetical protein